MGRMSYAFGDLSRFEPGEGQVLVVTTNGFVKRDGRAVMGRGIAKQMATQMPHLPKRLGSLLTQFGNRPFRLTERVWSLPVKHNWWEQADLVLIRTSLVKMGEMVDKFGIQEVHMPKPGCGNGRLDWIDVHMVMLEVLPAWKARVIVWDYPERKAR